MRKREVLTPEIIEEIPLEQVIDNTLVRNNVTEQVINALKEKYGNMKLSSIEDKGSYLDLCEARKEVRRVGILVEKCCKIGRESAIKIQKLWLSKEKQVLGQIAEVQDPLDVEIKKYEDEVERKENEIRQQQENNYQERQRVIIKMGAVYNNGSFELNGVSYDMDVLKTADKETWEEVMLPKYQREFEKLEVIRAAEEKKREEDAAKLKAEQEELERQKAELAKQQEEMRKQMEEINREKLEQERSIREQKQKEEDEYRKAQDIQNKARMQQVMGLGLTYSGQYKSFIFEDVAVAELDITGYDQEKWDKMIEEITPTIARNKEEVAKREQEKGDKEIEDAKQEAIALELKRQESERVENERKAIEEKERQAQEAEKASDKDKWTAFVSQYSEIKFPEMKTPTYKGKINSAKELHSKIIVL